MSKQNTQPAKRLIEIFDRSLSYCEPELKKAFHREGKKVLRKLAALMGLKKGQFDVRSNMAGIACSGEVILHTERLYVQIDQTIMGPQSVILMRTCNGRKDYYRWHEPLCTDYRPGGSGTLCALSRRPCAVIWSAVCCWVPEQVRIDLAQIRANRVISPQLERVRDRFENNEVSIEVFEQAIENAERIEQPLNLPSFHNTHGDADIPYGCQCPQGNYFGELT